MLHVVRRSLITSACVTFIALAACSSKSSSSGTLPAGAVTFTAGQAPSGLPSSCTGYTYVVIQDTALCSTDVYILCDGTTFGAYDCTLPPGYTPYSGGHTDAGNDATSESTKDAGSSSSSGSTSSSSSSTASSSGSTSNSSTAFDAGSGSGSGNGSGSSSSTSGPSATSCVTSGPGLTNCGAGGTGNESCCANPEVTGGTYYRTYTNTGSGPTGEADPAAVSAYSLDDYLVTVGRFREFVAAWNGGTGYVPPASSGKHSYLNGGQGLANSGTPGTYETGWLASDDSNIAPTTANLTTACDDPPFATWTATVGTQENLPITCVNWYESYAFCIWDGGFLPSEAEWGYAAAGGSQQREYPWGTTAPGTSNQYEIYGCLYPSGSGTCTLNTANVAPVGTPTLGAGLWGQLDMTGEVFEWNLDWFAPYVDPCTDCANLATNTVRVQRGARYDRLWNLSPSFRGNNTPVNRSVVVGFRCARAPGTGGGTGTGSGSGSGSASSSGAGDAGQGIVTLAAAQMNPEAITVDATSVYWTDYIGGNVLKAPLSGGTATTLASGQDAPGGIVVDSTSVYWTADDAVMKVPLNGGTPTFLAGTGGIAIAVDATSVYWVGGTAVMKVPIGGGTPTTLAPGQNGPWGIAVDATNVYWTNSVTIGSVMKVPIGGGAASTVASGQNYPWGMTIDATNVYWTNAGGGEVMTVPILGGTPTTLATMQSDAKGIVVDATNVYWTIEFMGGSVLKVPLSGGTPSTIATGQGGPWGMAADTASVYWTDYLSGTVMKAPK